MELVMLRPGAIDGISFQAILGGFLSSIYPLDTRRLITMKGRSTSRESRFTRYKLKNKLKREEAGHGHKSLNKIGYHIITHKVSSKNQSRQIKRGHAA
jgi:hypothetical protein